MLSFDESPYLTYSADQSISYPSRWLMSVGREEEAIRSLARLHARGDINDPFVIHEAAEIKSGVMFEKESEQGWKKVSLPKLSIYRSMGEV